MKIKTPPGDQVVSAHSTPEVLVHRGCTSLILQRGQNGTQHLLPNLHFHRGLSAQGAAQMAAQVLIQKPWNHPFLSSLTPTPLKFSCPRKSTPKHIPLHLPLLSTFPASWILGFSCSLLLLPSCPFLHPLTSRAVFSNTPDLAQTPAAI